MKTVIAILLTGIVGWAARAQPALIVRLADEAPAALVAALEAPGAAKQGPWVALFDGVTAARPVLPVAGAGKLAARPFLAYTLQTASEADATRLHAQWERTPGVAYVQRNHRYQLDAVAPAAEDPLLDSLSHFPVIRVREAWAVTQGRAEVRIGLIDTGLYFEHPDLAGQVWINPGEDLNANGRADAADFNGRDDDGNGYIDDVRGYDFVDRTATVEPGDYQDPDPDPSEDDAAGGGRGHGTLVAGVVSAGADNGVGMAGVAPGCLLVPLRAFGADGRGDDDDVAAAIVYAALQGIDVLNLSFGDVYYSPLMREAIQFATSQGTIVVASAGNLGGDDPHYPSDYPEVISAAWFNQDGTGIAGRGTYGVGIDVGAPGSFVFTTLLPRVGEDGTVDPEALYGRRSGSSLSAPMVAGAAALLRSLDVQLTPASVRGILTATAQDVDLPGWDERTAAGLLDMEAALTRALPSRVALTSPDHDSGWAGGVLPLIGTVIDPALASYTLDFAPGDADLDGRWTSLVAEQPVQVRDDTLTLWQTDDLADGMYTLRLQARLRTGKTIEDRRRVFLDRTPPVLTPRVFNGGLIGAAHGIVADFETDDLTELRLVVRRGGEMWTVHSDRKARRHGVAWADETGTGGVTEVEVIAVNTAGTATTLRQPFTVPPRTLHTALFTEQPLAVPHGYLLPFATDFDQDRLLEITLNRYEEGWIGDTLATFEWDGQAFRPVQQVLANVIPRDVWDTDGDGLLELLTQVAGATLVLEQPEAGSFPSAVSFIDTTGLGNPFSPGAAFGARLTDLDQDGRGEVLVHNTREWRLLEYDGTEYAEVSRLGNPTSTGNSEISQNEFQQPVALVDDFDADGRTDLLVGDGDGDWIIYEAVSDNRLRVAWTYETSRYNAGARFGKGDFDGDGRTEFVTYTQNWTQPTSAGEREPDLGLYYLWDSVGDDDYVLVDSLPVHSLLSRHGSLAADDFDADGRDELLLIDAPDLYVFSFDQDLVPTLRYHLGPETGSSAPAFRSVAQVVADFDGDGVPELIAGAADERLHRLVFQRSTASHPPPQWRAALARDAGTVDLAWTTSGADSVTVFRAAPGEALDPLVTTRDAAWVDARTAPADYALMAWYGGDPSPLSLIRTVQPRPAVRLVSLRYPTPHSVELLFSEPLAATPRAQQFTLADGTVAQRLLLARSDQAVLLTFANVAGRATTLRWTGLRDASGRLLSEEAVPVTFPPSPSATLFIVQAGFPSPGQVTLSFSAPLDPASASDPGHYRVRPGGTVAEAAWTESRPEEVRLTITGQAIGATGLEASLAVEGVQGAGGERLAPEGAVISLTRPADSLADAYVFPNPFRASQHAPRVMIAGLPPEASITILTLQGERVRTLEDRQGQGGIPWDLTDAGGRSVPSGIYLIRIEAPEEPPVLRKVALIR